MAKLMAARLCDAGHHIAFLDPAEQRALGEDIDIQWKKRSTYSNKMIALGRPNLPWNNLVCG